MDAVSHSALDELIWRLSQDRYPERSSEENRNFPHDVSLAVIRAAKYFTFIKMYILYIKNYKQIATRSGFLKFPVLIFYYSRIGLEGK